jgi:viologen exporter family transport system permease protein
MNAARLYLRYFGVSVRGQMQYRASFAMMAIGHFFATGIEIVGIWALFERFGSLRDWRLPEVAVFYGIINVSMSLGDAFARGFDWFPRMVRSGEFDRLLLRPRSTALQVAGGELTLFRIGRLAQALVVLLWGAARLEVAWTVARTGLLIFAMMGGACLFYALFVLQATLAFWTTETLELMNTLTYGGTETAQYPLSIYRPWFRKFFTFIVPLACVSYYPGLTILGRADPLGESAAWFGWGAPVIGIACLPLALLVWGIGVKHYHSTGS